MRARRIRARRAGARQPPGLLLLIVAGNPVEHISLLGDPEKDLKMNMKYGRIYRNALK